jgi:DNA-binding response OmpR family regulator
MNILLIEPDRVLADTYRQALESAGHSVRMCAGAQSAVFCADEVTPDVVLLELQLVGHSGLEFLYEFRSYPEWQGIPVVIHSNVPAGELSGSWKLLKEQLGVASYHYKPLTSLQTLLRTISSVIPAEAGIQSR